jgi:excinuclease ABC subunit A
MISRHQLGLQPRCSDQKGATITRREQPTQATESPADSAAGNGTVPWITVHGARHNNLKSVDAAFPLRRFTCVTGVSGSGKSSLVNDILYAALHRDLNDGGSIPGEHDRITGLEHLDKIIAIDQSPIGRTPRSNPATYIKLFDEIRGLFSKLPDAKVRGYKPGRFSFNVPDHRGGGRCEACEGNGANRIEMDFLADVWVECPVCSGHRFNQQTLRIKYKHKSIADVLEMDVQDALRHFENMPRICNMLTTLHDVGLDYIKLGQSSTTLSGGEAQRIKLARELVKRSTGRTFYVLDEPTTGLHFEDISRLLAVLHGFVDAGNTVVVIEHNLDVIKTADWIIDLGPEGGSGGGEIIATGTPEEIAADANSATGIALAEELAAEQAGSNRLKASKTQKAARLATMPTQDVITVRGARQHNLQRCRRHHWP